MWLVPSDGEALPVSPSEIMGSRRFRIPNTVIAFWAGAVGQFGKALVDWDRSVTYLARLGFNIVSYDHVPGNRLTLQGRLQSSANSKLLHGLYFWGHGIGQPSQGLMSHEGKDLLVWFSTLNLPYKMALGLIYACDSNSGKYALSSGTPGHIYHGYTGLLVPIPVPPWGHPLYGFAVWAHIKPGNQRTNWFLW